MNYHIHEGCELLVNREQEYITFPLLDKLVLFDYLFEEKFSESKRDLLYDLYSGLFYSRLLNNNEWSVVVYVEEPLEIDTWILIMKLAVKAILILNVFNENFVKKV